MKKLSFLLSLAMLCCLLCACDPSFYTIDQKVLDTVISIELIEYDNPNQKTLKTWVFKQFNKLIPFDPERVTVLETLPAEKNADFLESFSKTEILHSYYAYNSPKDICLRLNYANGDFLILWTNYANNSFAGYIGEYSSDGTVLSFWGSFSSLRYYEDLVEGYFTYSLQ